MRLTVVGCSGSFPGPTSPASSYLVESEHEGRVWRILLDLGSGALGHLQRYVDPLDVDAVFLTHLHPDHFFDLSGYYVLRKYHPKGPQPRIPIYGPTRTAERVASAYGLPSGPGMSREFDFRVYDGQPAVLGPFTVETVRVEHPVEAYALRVSAAGSTVVYSGDTGPCEALVELARGADLLLAEASFRDGDENPAGLHLTGAQAAQAATEAEVGRLVLTHIPPWHDPEVALAEAKGEYDGLVEVAIPGAAYDL